MPSGVVIVAAPSGPVMNVNSQALRILGYEFLPPDALSGPGRLVVLHLDGSPYPLEEVPVMRSIRTGEAVIGEEMEVERPDGTRITVRTNSAPVRDSAGRIIAGVTTFADITRERQGQQERDRLAAQLKQQARLLETILESAPGGIAYLDRGLRFARVNSAYRRSTGRSDGELVGRPYAEAAPQGEEILPLLQAVLDTGEPQVLPEIPGPSGERDEEGPRYFMVSLIPVKDQVDRTEGVVIFHGDVTHHVRQRERMLEAERARAELAENLSREISHRTKNNLAMVAGLLRMQISQTEDPHIAGVLRDTASRILTFASLHEQLQATQEGGVNLLSTVRRIVEATQEVLAAREIETVVDGRPVVLPPQVAANLAVVVNELVTNAVKHGASAEDGRLHVEAHVGLEAGRLRLTVWNSGNPVREGFDAVGAPTMGLRLVRGVVVDQYGGSFALRPSAAGTLAEVVLDEDRMQ